MKIKAIDVVQPAERAPAPRFELEVHCRYPMVFECFDALPRPGPLELNVSVKLWPGTSEEVQFGVVGLSRGGESVNRSHEALKILGEVFERGTRTGAESEVRHE